MVERKLAEEADVQAMHAKLAKRSGSVTGNAVEKREDVKPPDAAQSLKAKDVINLEWETPVEGAMAIKTKCGRYSVAKIVVNGKTSYELWKFVPSAIWFHQLAIKLPSFKEARRLAEKDVNK